MFGKRPCTYRYDTCLKRKKSGTKSVDIATSKYVPCGVFRRVQYWCEFSIIMLLYLQGYYRCHVFTSYYHNSRRHQLSNLHNTKSLISLE